MRKMLTFMLVLCLASAVAAGEKRTLKFGVETARTDSQYIGAKAMADYIHERDDTLEVRIYPDSALGNTVSAIGQTRSGTIDIYLSGAGNYAGMIESLNAFDVPFLFKDYAHVDRVMDGGIGRAIMDDAEDFDMKGLALWENGFRCLTNSRNPARTPADVKGLKIRVPGMPMHVKAWELLGANPVPMNYSEVFTALETKTIDAQDHPINVTYSARFYEMQEYMSVSNHAYTPLLLVMNLKAYQSLTPDQQKLMLEAGLHGAREQRKFVRENVAKYTQEIADYGVEVIPAEEMDMKPWRDLVFDAMVEHVQANYPKATEYLKQIVTEGEK